MTRINLNIQQVTEICISKMVCDFPRTFLARGSYLNVQNTWKPIVSSTEIKTKRLLENELKTNNSFYIKYNIAFGFPERWFCPPSKHCNLKTSRAISIAPISSRNGLEVIKILVPIFTCRHIRSKNSKTTKWENHKEDIYTHRNKCISHWTAGSELEDCIALQGRELRLLKRKLIIT